MLQKGLTFTPTSSLDKFEFIKDVYLFCRQLTFKLLYDKPSLADELPQTDRQVFEDLMLLLEEAETPGTGKKIVTPHKPSTATIPFKLFPNINMFFQLVVQDVTKLRSNPLGGRNLSKKEQQAIQSLNKNTTFIIKEADKGGNIVLWPTGMYVEEAKKQLSNTRFYLPVPSDPTDVFQRKLTRLLDSAKTYGIITKRLYEYLKVEKPMTATFYLLPKIHKDPIQPPGRPIVAGIGSLCEKASVFLDLHLQPLAQKLPSYLRDSAHLIQELEKCVFPEGTLLVTCDVESLYSNIAHDDGIKAATYFLVKENLNDDMFVSFLLDLLCFVLHHNYFVFDRVYYRQVSGTAMGARCAPSYANLFLGWWEGTRVYPSPDFTGCVVRWFRYIDDVLFFWNGTVETCEAFITELNQNPWNIKLTHCISNNSVDFLDLKLCLQQNKVTTNLFRKETATDSLLHFNSFHPTHTKTGIPTGQFGRLRRICSKTEDFLEKAGDLTIRFKDRGYPKQVVSKAFQKAYHSDRQELLQPRQRMNERKVRLVTMYNNQWRNIHGIISTHWNVLQLDPRLKRHITDRPTLTARRAANLKDKLVSSHFQRPTTPIGCGNKLKGSYPCGRCNVCQFVTSTVDFENPSLGGLPRVKLKHYINCQTRNVIYALTCPCSRVYVGQTTQKLKQRIQQHLSNISLAARDRTKGKTLTSVASHFLDHHDGKYDRLQVVGLDKVLINIRGRNVGALLLRRESRWIFELNTLHPTGLNEELLFTGFYKS